MIDLAALNLGATLPATLLAFGAALLFIYDLSVPQDKKHRTMWFAVAGILVSLVATVLTLNQGGTAFFGAFQADAFTSVVNVAVLLTALISVLAAQDYLKRTNMNRGEYFPLLLMTAAGAMFMAAARDLVIVLIALELLSIPLYVLVGFRRPEIRSEEGAMKYFLLGAFSSGFLVYGIALVYGAAGSTNLATIFDRVRFGELTSVALLLLGTGLIFVSLGFKVAAVPFHVWTPDVYEGAPSPVTAYMSVAAKVGGFAAMLRLLTIALPSFVVGEVVVDPGQTLIVHTAWQDLVAVIAGLTMILGNFVALTQRDIKRMLAYSSIAHAGYILMAVAAAGSFAVTASESGGGLAISFRIAEEAMQGALIYLLAYAFTNVGAFSVAIALERDDASGTEIANFAGLGQTRPWLAGAMVIFMLSLTGIPLTGGFVGKYFVFLSSVNAGLTLLALIGVLTSVVSAFYYLRIIVTMWFEPGESQAAVPHALQWAIGLSAAGTLLIGILPPLVTNLVQNVTSVALR